MKKLMLIQLLAVVCIAGYAYDIKVENADGVTIYYNYINDGTELEVAKANYHDIVNIPEEVTYMNRTRTVTSIGYTAFYDCRALTSVTIPNSVTTIGSFAFSDCPNLTTVTIPNSVTTIGSYAFRRCYGLTSVIIGNSVTTIGNYAFAYCRALTSVNIPNTVTTIGESAFSGCSSLTSVNIPNTMTTIDAETFLSCVGLTSVFIGNNVTTIGERAFSGCKALASVNIPNSVHTIGGSAFSNCDGMTSVIIGNNVTTIGESAFSGCKALSSVNIPNSVHTIGNSAFSNCDGMTSVTIGNSVTTIYQGAFSGCSGIVSVVSKMENPCEITNDCFHQDVSYNSTLYVPQGTIEIYKSTNYWNKFLFIEEGDGPNGSEPTNPEKCATPTIHYANGKVTFDCETEGVTFHPTVTNPGLDSYDRNEVQLSMIYNVQVYASKFGYDDSDVATMTIDLSESVGNIKGDINKDGFVNMTDVTEIINIILGK